MSDNRPEVTIALSRCKESNKIYGVRFQKIRSNQWMYTWAFPVKEDTARREGYDSAVITGAVAPHEEYPGCPYCGSRYFVVCGSCGRLNCKIVTGDTFSCGWCGMTGRIVDYDGTGIQGGGDR